MDNFFNDEADMCEETVSLMSGSHRQGEEFRFEVSLSRLNTTPTWMPESEPVPLSPSEAVQQGLAYAYEQRPRFDSCLCISIALHSVNQRSDLSRWFYFLQFIPVMGGRNYHSDLISVVVLLDGTIVEPEIVASEASGY